MRFSILLFFLGYVLKIGALVSKSFKRYIEKKRVKVLIKTADGKHARLFVFDRSRVTAIAGDHSEFDVALIFKDAKTGFSVLTSKDKHASFNAAADGQLKVEGMSFYAQWFEDGTKIIL